MYNKRKDYNNNSIIIIIQTTLLLSEGCWSANEEPWGKLSGMRKQH